MVKKENGDVFDVEKENDNDARELSLYEREESLKKKESELAAREAALNRLSPPADVKGPMVKVKVAARRSVHLGGNQHHLPGTVIEITKTDQIRLKKMGFVVDLHEAIITDQDNLVTTLDNKEGVSITVNDTPRAVIGQ